MSDVVKPYSEQGSKREQVEHMFDRISPKYDLLNRLCSLGTDQGWRRKVVRAVGKEPVDHLLDVAGKIVRKAMLARFARSFSLSLKSGVPISQALSVVAQTVDNQHIARRIDGMRDSVNAASPCCGQPP